jgi:virginiamycin B lyase
MKFPRWLRPLAARLDRTPTQRAEKRPGDRLTFEALENRSVPSVTIQEFPLAAGSHPNAIHADSDGNIWFTETGGLGRISPSGQITDLPLGFNIAGEFEFGKDGNIWVGGGRHVREITPQGVLLHDYILPSANDSSANMLAVGADGSIWCTEASASVIARITPDGQVTEFPIPLPAVEITAGPDGNFWFDPVAQHAIGRITPTGDVTMFFDPNLGENIRGLTSGPNGNLWMESEASTTIDEVNTAGQLVTTFSNSDPAYILTPETTGPDSNLWFTTQAIPPHAADGGNHIGSLTPQGVFTDYPIPTPNSGPDGITAGPDGNIWFTENGANQIGEVVLNQSSVTPAFDSLAGPTITYGTASVTLSGHIAAGSAVPPGSEDVTLNGVTQHAAIDPATGNFSATFSTSTLPVTGSPYTITYAYAGATGFNPVTDTSKTLTVTKATPAITTTGGCFAFDGQPHPAPGSVVGVNGENLGTPTFSYSFTDDNGNVITQSGLPTDPGYYTLTASFAGNDNYKPTSKTVSVTIYYEAHSLTDLSQAFHAGRTIPIKLQLTDANGNNLSSPDITLTAIRLEQVNADGSTTRVALQDAGNANPGNLFRYDADLGGYIFNLSTKNLAAGKYHFFWAAEGDPTAHELDFQLT